MAIEVVVPRSGWSMEEGTFAGWIKQPGETVKVGDRLFALESDKSVEEAESMDPGIVWLPPGAPKTGDRVKVGQLLGYLLAPGEAPPSSAPVSSAPTPGAPPAAPAPPAEPATAPIPVPAAKVTELSADIGGRPLPVARPTPVSPVPLPVAAAGSKPSTPRARRTAKEMSVDLADVTGTGRGGRIRERDVQASAADRSEPAGELAPLAEPSAGGAAIAISRMRRTIAERMVRSLNETAPVTLTTRGDASALVKLRTQLAGVIAPREKDGKPTAPSYTEIIIKIVAKVLKQHSLLAARWETDRLVFPAAMNIGLAVDTPDGLLVPVIRDADVTPLVPLAGRVRTLVDGARRKQLRPDELRGGVFTITSLGQYGIDEFTPIINLPETAILGVGAIRKGQWFDDEGEASPREQITLSLTFDHRVVDGAPAAAFLQAVREAIARPAAWALVDLPSTS